MPLSFTAAVTVTGARIGARAARVLVGELARRPAPKRGLLVGVVAGSPVLAAATDALLPADSLAVLPAPGHEAAARAEVAALGPWVSERVTVLDAPPATAPASLTDRTEPLADVVIVAQPLAGTAGEARAALATAAAHLAPGGVAVAATPARHGRYSGIEEPAAQELARAYDTYGIGSDLVVRNVPPLRVYRLRYEPADSPGDSVAADLKLADQLAPTHRPSSVRLWGGPDTGMNIDSNGVAAGAICLGVAALTRTVSSSKLWLVPALAAAPVAAFFRDPQRLVPTDPDVVVAASDGKVLAVERLVDDRLSEPDTRWLRISVFLSVLDVHVNRAPVAGRVVDVFNTRGGYAAAMKPSAEHNVAAYTVLATPRGRVVVAQRTGLVARRIVTRVRPGALLAKGERFGLIRFGSRTDVYLPDGTAEPLVVPGDRVVGGTTPLARFLP